jgi:hypothetical protein
VPLSNAQRMQANAMKFGQNKWLDHRNGTSGVVAELECDDSPMAGIPALAKPLALGCDALMVSTQTTGTAKPH